VSRRISSSTCGDNGDEGSQECFDRVEELRHVGVGERTAAKILGRDESEVSQHDAEHFGARHVRVVDHRGERPRPQRFQHRATQGRLARAGFAGQEQDAFATPQTVQQLTEPLLVRRAQVKELRVGRDREWLVGETVEGLVDGICQRSEGRRLHGSIIRMLPARGGTE
jgi:hypothetical protein